MKKLLKIVTISLTLAGSTFASSESHKFAAKEVLVSMKMDQLLSQSIEAMLQLELNNNPAMLPFENIMRAFFEKHMSAKSLESDFIALYVDQFTEVELNGISEFYNTPLGQKILEATPEITARSAALGQQRVMGNISELENMIEAETLRLQSLQKEATPTEQTGGGNHQGHNH